MTEQDYINATNLAKVRIAIAVIRDVSPMGAADEKNESEAMSNLWAWEQRLTALVGSADD
jgi:hypothetical protein